MSEFVEFLHEVFEHFGPIHSRRMFGSHGIYHNDLMFALVADDVLYLKGDEQTIPLYEQHDMQPFEIVMKGNKGTMKYYSAPDEIYDDPEAAKIWAERAFDTALRAAAAKQKRKKTAGKKKINK